MAGLAISKSVVRAKSGNILPHFFKLVPSCLGSFCNGVISKNLGFGRPTWRQVGTKTEAEIDVIFERRLFEKSCSPCSESSNSQDSGDEVGSKNRSKNDVKNDAERERLGNSIFIDF